MTVVKTLHRSRVQTDVLILKERLGTIQSHRWDCINKNNSSKINEKCISSRFRLIHETNCFKN